MSTQIQPVNSTMEINKIYCMDAIEFMKQINDKSIDMILCDLPYGTTDCQWDEIIPLDKMWEQYKRIIRNNGFMVLFCSQPFTTKLINSNIEDFSHQWIWEKEQGTNPLIANLMPMKNFEDILNNIDEYEYFDREIIRLEARSYIKEIKKRLQIMKEKK